MGTCRPPGASWVPARPPVIPSRSATMRSGAARTVRRSAAWASTELRTRRGRHDRLRPHPLSERQRIRFRSSPRTAAVRAGTRRHPREGRRRPRQHRIPARDDGSRDAALPDRTNASGTSRSPGPARRRILTHTPDLRLGTRRVPPCLPGSPGQWGRRVSEPSDEWVTRRGIGVCCRPHEVKSWPSRTCHSLGPSTSWLTSNSPWTRSPSSSDAGIRAISLI